MNLLKTCAERHIELEAKFYEILGDIYYYKLKETEANNHSQDIVCNYYHKALEILKSPKKTDLNNLVKIIKLKKNKIQSQLENVSENSIDQNKLLLKNSYIEPSDGHTFFANRKPTCTDDLEQSMRDSQNNYLESEISNQNSKEEYQEIGKKHN